MYVDGGEIGSIVSERPSEITRVAALKSPDCNCKRQLARNGTRSLTHWVSCRGGRHYRKVVLSTERLPTFLNTMSVDGSSEGFCPDSPDPAKAHLLMAVDSYGVGSTRNKYFMRLNDITPKDIIEYLDTTEDRDLGWIMRAHNSQRVKTREYMQMIEDELHRARTILSQYDLPTLTLYRGLETPVDTERENRHWTPVKNIAYDFGNHIYRAEVTNSMVDWVATVVHRIGHHHEQEITLKRGARPALSLVEGMRRWIDLIRQSF